VTLRPFFSLEAAEKHKNTFAFIFPLKQHAARGAEKLMKLSLKDAHSAAEYMSCNSPGKEQLRRGRQYSKQINQ